MQFKENYFKKAIILRSLNEDNESEDENEMIDESTENLNLKNRNENPEDLASSILDSVLKQYYFISSNLNLYC